MGKPAFLLLIALAALCAPIFASYTESINIIVVDQLGRPVPYATVWAEYWVRYEDRANTSMLLTGPDGIARVRFDNYDPDTGARTKYDYKISVKFGSSTTSVSLVHNLTTLYRENPYPLKVTSYVLRLRLLDQSRAPHANTSIFWGYSAATTDAGGNAVLQVGSGQINLTLRKAGFESIRALTLTNDTFEQIIWPIYSPKVRVIDDRGEPLPAAVEMGGIELTARENGTVQFPQTPLPSAEITVSYGRREKKAVADFSSQDSLTIVLDTHAPVFRSTPQVELVEGLGRITIDVADEGQYASGFDENSHFIVRYRVKGRERDASMYTVKRGTYQADIPVQPPNTYVSFSITISDKDGNTRTAIGEYIIPSASRPGGGNATGGGTTPAGELIFGLEPAIAYAGIAAALLALIGGYMLLRRKKSEDY